MIRFDRYASWVRSLRFATTLPMNRNYRYLSTSPSIQKQRATAHTKNYDDNGQQFLKTIRPRSMPKSTLPRSLEEAILRSNPNVQYVLGIDEAGRGPLAGPVVVAAVRMMSPTATPAIVEGVTDCKKIVSEVQREKLFQQLIQSFTYNSETIDEEKYIMWAVAVVDAATIDKINILEATMLGMRIVSSVIIGKSIKYPVVNYNDINPGIPQNGCYVFVANGVAVQMHKSTVNDCIIHHPVQWDESYYAFVDGNKIPSDMPCQTEAITKGDTREYSIAAASILAKVTRDRIMHQYHEQYPQYNFSQHKGYPTVAHIAAIRTFGPSPIHRLSFSPLRNMYNNET
jgi:ribonuclease HII